MKKWQRLSYIGLLSLTMSCSPGHPHDGRSSVRPADFELTNPGNPERGTLLEATHLATLSKDQLAVRLQALGLTPQNAVHIYRIVYQSEGLDESPIKASGIVLLPASVAPVHPWISLQHGTISSKVDAPSANPSEGVIEASLGFYTAAMDYIGFGAASDVLHPYIIAKAYANAGVDMLRAARSFAEKNSLKLGPLFLKGYSEGGYATLALQRALETDYQGEFPIAAAAPAAGPYDLETTSMVLLGKININPVNLPYLLLSYKRWLAPDHLDLSKVLKVDLQLLDQLFSGEFRSQDIYRQLPSETTALFQADMLTDYTSASPKLPDDIKIHALLQEQSLHNQTWIPSSPTRLYHCNDDDTVPVEATKSTYAAFNQRSSTSPVSMVIIPSPDPEHPYTHTTCPAILTSLQWFKDILMSGQGTAR